MKHRFITTIIIFIIIILIVLWCFLKPENKYWVICCAFSLEYETLTKCFDRNPVPKEFIGSGIKYSIGKIKGLRCVICNVGISIVNASRGSQFIIDLIGSKNILGMIFMGIGGSVNEDIIDGDVVCPESWVYYGHQLYNNEDSSNNSELIKTLPIAYQPPFKCNSSNMTILKTYQLTENGEENYISQYHVDPDLYEISRSLDSRVKGYRIVKNDLSYFRTGGIGISAPIFQADSNYINYLRTVISKKLTIVDEETTAMAHSCSYYQIPWIGIRLVSDVEIGTNQNSSSQIYLERLRQTCISWFEVVREYY